MTKAIYIPLATILFLSAALIYSHADPPPNTITYAPAQVAGVLDDEKMTELSGVVSGGINHDILWVHNDRFNPPLLFALNTQGEKVATYGLDLVDDDGMMAGDWEDMAKVPGPKKGSFEIYIGNIGNNALEIKEQTILVVTEPTVTPSASTEVLPLAHKTIRYRYPDGYACNSECLFVHPESKEIYIISKKINKDGKKKICSLVWSLPAVTDFEKVYTAKLVMNSIPVLEPFKTDKKKGSVTGGDISSDGKYLILRTYDQTAHLWIITKDQSIKNTLKTWPQKVILAEGGGGEAICFSPDGSKLFTVYDGKKTGRPIHRYQRKK